jgi:outer membrane protein assembly factor BamB
LHVIHDCFPRTLLAALALVFLLAAPLHAADWPQFLGPQRNGVSPETDLLLAWPKAGPEPLWQHALGEGYSGPVVAAGRVIVFHRIADKEIVECLDAKTGTARWKYPYKTRYSDNYGKKDGPRATPLIDGKRVYTLGAEGTLTCVDFDKGTKVWSRNISTDYEVRPSFFGVGTAPLVEGNLLLVNVGGKGAGVVAFDKETGKEAWKATDDGASYSSPVAATIDGVRHVFFFTRQGILSLDPKTGAVRFQKRWRARIDASVNAAAPLILGDHVLFSSSYRTGAILLRARKDAADEVWKSDEVLSSHYASMVAKGDHVFGFDGRQEEGARLRCIDARAGKVLWSKENFGCGTIVRAGDLLLMLLESGELVLADASPKAYHERARARILKPTRAPFALADGCVFARDDERIVCLKVAK